MIYHSSEVGTVHLEVTSRCNARCPMCLRNVCGGKENPQLPITDLSLSDIKNIFPEQFIGQLKRLFMCGNYGDPVVSTDTLEIFEYLRKINPKIRLELFTNGSARSQKWWAQLAQVVDLVHFSVDGLGDVNQIYRRGTQFDKIMENIKAYVSSGGEGVWDYIVFRHNEHQIDEARALC
ncbi:MAG: radical SAM protein, partial [Pseudomonadota bacterium]